MSILTKDFLKDLLVRVHASLTWITNFNPKFNETELSRVKKNQLYFLCLGVALKIILNAKSTN